MSVSSHGNPGKAPSINSEGYLDSVQHAHPDSGIFHFHASSIAASQDFILIDISDDTNYPHAAGSYAHLEWLNFQVDATAAF